MGSEYRVGRVARWATGVQPSFPSSMPTGFRVWRLAPHALLTPTGVFTKNSCLVVR